MKMKFAVPVILVTMASVASAAEQVVIERGGAKLSLEELDARMERFPYQERALYARRTDNMGRLMDQLLLNKQLAKEARDLGLDKDPKIQIDLQMAVEEVLSLHRLNQLTSPEKMPDLDQLAQEQYQSNRNAYQVPESREVRHILVSNENREAAEAERLAQTIAAEAGAPNADFAALVEKYSDDPAKSANKGLYVISKEGEYAPAFEAAARGLSSPGEISQPVKTDFGYHIIRLESITPARIQAFEEVRPRLIAEMRANYYKRVREDHLSLLKAQPEIGNEELLKTLPARYGARPEEAIRQQEP